MRAINYPDKIVVHIQDEEKQMVRAYGRMVLVSFNSTYLKIN